MNTPAAPYVQKLENLFTQHADPEYARWSRQYSRNQFAFLGIKTPLRRKLTKQFFAACGHPAKENLTDVIYLLWDLEEREYQQAALDMMKNEKKLLTPEDMPWLSSLLTKKSWWDTVDVLSPHIMGYMFTMHPGLVHRYPDHWIHDESIWLQRAAILYQLYYKEATDERRLFQYVELRAGSREFSVQKSIGWALRQYARTNPEKAREYVHTHDLQPLSRREALKHL